MNNLVLFKTLYREAFKNLANKFLTSYLKFLTWASFSLIGIVAYAFIYRMVTGFYF